MVGRGNRELALGTTSPLQVTSFPSSSSGKIKDKCSSIKGKAQVTDIALCRGALPRDWTALQSMDMDTQSRGKLDTAVIIARGRSLLVP